jgi:hypothetical protein
MDTLTNNTMLEEGTGECPLMDVTDEKSYIGEVKEITDRGAVDAVKNTY